MVKTLEMVFRNEGGKTVTLSILEPNDNLTMAEVSTVMQGIISKNVFSTVGGALVQVVEARIRSNDMAILA